jgi:hypothetical protein
MIIEKVYINEEKGSERKASTAFLGNEKTKNDKDRNTKDYALVHSV